MLHEPVINNVKNDNGGKLLISVFVVFFAIATVLGIICNHYEAKGPHTCFIPSGNVDPSRCI